MAAQAGPIDSCLRKPPSAALPPVLAGIRANKSGKLPSHADCTVARRLAGHDEAVTLVLPLRGQHTLAVSCTAPCFPFNCTHGHARGHQNPAIVSLSAFARKFHWKNLHLPRQQTKRAPRCGAPCPAARPKQAVSRFLQLQLMNFSFLVMAVMSTNVDPL